MVFLEPPRSRVLDRQRQQSLAAEAQHRRSKRAQSLLRTADEGGAMTTTSSVMNITDAARPATAFVASLDAYVGHFARLARGDGPLRPSSKEELRLPTVASSDGATTAASSPFTRASIRPSSANVAALSREAPFRNQYTVSAVVADSSNRNALAASMEGASAGAATLTHAKGDTSVNGPVAAAHHSSTLSPSAVRHSLHFHNASGSIPPPRHSPITGLATSFYADLAAHDDAKRQLARSKVGAPSAPSATLHMLSSCSSFAATPPSAAALRYNASGEPSPHATGDGGADPSLEVDASGATLSPQRSPLVSALPLRARPSTAGHNTTTTVGRCSSKAGLTTTAMDPNGSFSNTLLGKIKRQLCGEADATFQHLQRCTREYYGDAEAESARRTDRSGRASARARRAASPLHTTSARLGDTARAALLETTVGSVAPTTSQSPPTSPSKAGTSPRRLRAAGGGSPTNASQSLSPPTSPSKARGQSYLGGGAPLSDEEASDSDGDGMEDYMLSVLVEAATNESMRSGREQVKTALRQGVVGGGGGISTSMANLGANGAEGGVGPIEVGGGAFSTFAEHNSLLEFLGGQSRDVNGVNTHQLQSMTDSERHQTDVLANKVKRGFSHRGLEVASEVPVAIIFPPYDALAVNSSDGKRPLDEKRYDVHSRCVLVGTLVLPPTHSRAGTKQPSGALNNASGSGANTAGPKTSTQLGNAGPTRALGQLSAPHPFRSAGAFDPSAAARPTATTVTAEAHCQQQRRRATRDRVRRQKALESIERKASSYSTEQQAEAAIAAQRFAEAEAEAAAGGPRSDEAILEEVLLARRGYRVAPKVVEAMRRKMRREGKPLRPMRDVRRVPVPGFVEYRDCFVRPRLLACYEVPNNRLDAPPRSTLDPAALMTTRASLFDDLYPFEKLEYTTRWGLPIRALGPAAFGADCWVRKVVRFPTASSDFHHPHSTYGGTTSPRRGDGDGGDLVPLGVLLQACGRGAVSIDIEGPQQPPPSIGSQQPPPPPLHYRHSFLFAERSVAAVMRERRYGKNSRHVGQPQMGGVGLR